MIVLGKKMKLVTNRQHLVGQEVAHSVKSSSRKLLVWNERKNVDIVQKFSGTLARKNFFLLYAKSAMFRERVKLRVPGVIGLKLETLVAILTFLLTSAFAR